MAPFEIRGLDASQVRYAYGVDPLQGLILAIEGIRVTFDKSRPRLTWLGGPPSEIGLSRLVPDLGSRSSGTESGGSSTVTRSDFSGNSNAAIGTTPHADVAPLSILVVLDLEPLVVPALLSSQTRRILLALADLA